MQDHLGALRRSVSYLAVLSIACFGLLPLATATAGPGQHDACSGSVCASLRHSVRAEAGRVAVSAEPVFGGTGSGDAWVAAGAVLTIHDDPGLIPPDPGDVHVDAQVPPDIKVSGNDIVITLNAAARDEVGATFDAAVEANQHGLLHTWSEFTFTAQDGGPAATATSADATAYAGPNLTVGAVGTRLLQPRLDFGLWTDRFPHGVTSAAQTRVDNESTNELPAGGRLDVTLAPWMSLASLGEVVSVAHGYEFDPLVCTGASPTWSCTLPAIAAADSIDLLAKIAVPDDAKVGQTGTVRMVVDPSSIGDLDPADNSAEAAVGVGAVARLKLALQESPQPVAVGASATVTATVTNDGPDAADLRDDGTEHAALASLVFESLDPLPTITDRDGGYLWTQLGREGLYLEVGVLAPGASKTFTIELTPNDNHDVAISFAVNAQPSTLFMPCDTDPDTTCAPVVQRLLHVGPGALPQARGQQSPPLAATGSRIGELLGLGVLLVAVGLALSAAGRRRAA